jgi:carbohydrate-selective porin OprB
MQRDHQRPRASSSASVTKRISNFIRSNSSNSIKQRGRSQSGSCLQYSVANSNDRIASSLAALDNNVDLISFRRQTKMANTSVEQQGQQEKVTIRS